MAKIKNKLRYPVKEEPTLDDYVVGTCAETGKTMNFSIRKLLALSTCCDENVLDNKFWYFQFNNLDLTSNINNTYLLDDLFLSNNGGEFTEEQALLGLDINFTNASRFGFVIENASDNSFKILNDLGLDITTTGFDKYFDNTEKKLFFVSKEYIAPSEIFFKFEKIV